MYIFISNTNIKVYNLLFTITINIEMYINIEMEGMVGERIESE